MPGAGAAVLGAPWLQPAPAKASQQALAKALLSLAQNSPPQKQSDLNALAEEAAEDWAPLLAPLRDPVRSGLVQAVQAAKDPADLERAKAKAMARNITFSPFMGSRGLVPLRGVGQRPTSSWRKVHGGGWGSAALNRDLVKPLTSIGMHSKRGNTHELPLPCPSPTTPQRGWMLWRGWCPLGFRSSSKPCVKCLA